MAITGPGDHYIAPERRCGDCGDLLGLNAFSPCEKCAKAAPRQRGATKAQLEYRERLFGVTDAGTTRAHMLASVLKMSGAAR